MSNFTLLANKLNTNIENKKHKNNLGFIASNSPAPNLSSNISIKLEN